MHIFSKFITDFNKALLRLYIIYFVDEIEVWFD